ncbi:SsgA family sporulation/cell division regulator [Streptomyces sp. NPDC050400]|uniref:SsgA family sporulation/cell division regulator n=1 Tax=Streptomyces sp. NPDC050400 TaxID=3365610 RepID=UPI00379D152D
MHVSLESPTGARLLTPDGREFATPVTLRHTSAEPLAVRLCFPPHVTLDGEAATWTIARELLAAGLDAPARTETVRVQPDGPADTLIEFHSPEGLAALRFDTAGLRRFLLRTHTVGPSRQTAEPAPAPAAAEDVVVPFDARAQDTRAALLGRRLRDIRQEQDLSLRQAAAAAGLSTLWAAQIEAGEILDLETMSHYARCLGAELVVSVEYAGRARPRAVRRQLSRRIG